MYTYNISIILKKSSLTVGQLLTQNLTPLNVLVILALLQLCCDIGSVSSVSDARPPPPRHPPRAARTVPLRRTLLHRERRVQQGNESTRLANWIYFKRIFFTTNRCYRWDLNVQHGRRVVTALTLAAYGCADLIFGFFFF